MEQVNVGTEDKPIFVPKVALDPESEEGKEWWNRLADGSVILTGEQLLALLAYLKKEGK